MTASFPRLTLFVHGAAESIEAVRARGLSQGYPPERIQHLWREGSRWQTALRWHKAAAGFRPEAIYVMNTALPGALLARWWKRRQGIPYLLDTGDVIYEMALRSGIGAPWKRPALRLVENAAQRAADTIIVRGTRHLEFLKRQGFPAVELIRDGFERGRAVDRACLEILRHDLGLAGSFVVGVMGSLVFSPRLKVCYGWDLIRALALLPDLPVRGLIVGDGDGRAWLEAEARRLGVRDRIRFCGRIPYAAVPTYLQLMDVALSTQTNNLPGQVRTTGKLPEYMAAERFIVASRVGEAALVLPEIMLLEYQGEVDPEYPAKLAERIRLLYREPRLLESRRELPELAERLFAYETLSRRFTEVIRAVAGRRIPGFRTAGLESRL